MMSRQPNERPTERQTERPTERQTEYREKIEISHTAEGTIFIVIDNENSDACIELDLSGAVDLVNVLSRAIKDAKKVKEELIRKEKNSKRTN